MNKSVKRPPTLESFPLPLAAVARNGKSSTRVFHKIHRPIHGGYRKAPPVGPVGFVENPRPGAERKKERATCYPDPTTTSPVQFIGSLRHGPHFVKGGRKILRPRHYRSREPRNLDQSVKEPKFLKTNRNPELGIQRNVPHVNRQPTHLRRDQLLRTLPPSLARLEPLPTLPVAPDHRPRRLV